MADNTNLSKLPPQAGTELGKSGTYIFYGYISAEEYNSEIRGKAGLQTLDIMRRSDPTIRAALLVCKNPVIGASWSMKPASDDPTDVEIAKFCDQELFHRNIVWPDTVREGLTCLDFGHSIFEKVLGPSTYKGQPRIGITKIASRKQRSIMRWATSDNQPGVTQITPTGGMIDIPRDKLIYIVNEREGENWEGIPLLRFAYKPWKIKDSLEIMHAIALERMSLGIPVARKNQNNMTTDESELAKVRQALRALRNNEEAYIEIPDSVLIEMLDMKGNSTKDILPTIQYYDRQITLSVLAQFLELGATGSGGSGSRAVSADHSQLFIKSLDAVARTIQQAFQNDLVKQLVDLNYSNLPNGYPQLDYSGLSDDDVKEISDAVSALMTAGALTADADLENNLRERLGLPELTKDRYENYDQDQQSQEGNEPGAEDNTTALQDAKKQLPPNKPAAKKPLNVSAEAKRIQAQLLANILDDHEVAA